ncbi:MAG TPA: isocitrate/isopropylmalate family dehydrogenase, partial [Sphingomonas sp.]
AMLLRHSLGEDACAARIENAVAKALVAGARTADLGGSLTTGQMGDAVLRELK